MRYNSYINNVKATEWGLNIQLAYLFSWFYELPSWAESVIIENESYYFASKNKAVKELPLLTDKPDTMYRYYKKLESLNLVNIKKIEGKDYVNLTSKSKEWNSIPGSQSDNSENNPTVLGNESENNSDLNPTYNIINKHNTINNNLYSEKDFLEDWGKCRKAYLKLPTHIAKLEIFEALNFKKATNIFTREQIQSAMKGLFLQEIISFSSMTTKPNHFLERVEQYYMAYESKDFKQYGSKKAQE